MTVLEHGSVFLPGSQKYICVSIAGITQGQTRVTVRSTDGRTLVQQTSVRLHDNLPFKVGREQHILSFIQIIDSLFGNDSAVFKISKSAHSNGR